MDLGAEGTPGSDELQMLPAEATPPVDMGHLIVTGQPAALSEGHTSTISKPDTDVSVTIQRSG